MWGGPAPPPGFSVLGKYSSPLALSSQLAPKKSLWLNINNEDNIDNNNSSSLLSAQVPSTFHELFTLLITTL